MDREHGEFTGHLQFHPPKEKCGTDHGERRQELGRSFQSSDPSPGRGNLVVYQGNRATNWRSKHTEEQRYEKGKAPRLILLYQKAEQPPSNEAEQPKRVGAGQQTVNEINPPFARRRRLQPLDCLAKGTGDASPQVSEGSSPQVRHVEPVAQQVIAVEFDERIEIELGLDSRSHHDHQRQVVECRGWIGHAPNQCRQRPQKQLEIRARSRHPKPLGLLREQPGIADVAVKSRL